MKQWKRFMHPEEFPWKKVGLNCYINHSISGELLVQTKLSETLEKVATFGVDVFYTGEIATNLVNDIQSAGGIITLEDLASYQPIVFISCDFIDSFRPVH